MNIEESIQNITHLFIDTAPVIYYVEQNSKYLETARAVFNYIGEGILIAVTSPITLSECLVRPYSLGKTQLQQYFIDVIVDANNTIFVPIDNQNIALEAAKIRAKCNLQLPDAFQIAVALAAECEALSTNDAVFKRLTELTILLLDELEI
ncbi:MAG: PIN domain-containing protein [Okeania sp. SIO3I5]|uniref:type II toxin-antitoxin system VapC family toxin n=1 Tax=Okeania sp. SIO3I5 TaxID=2607805 RepID=UPI0013B5ED09|nr:PIN domain-containing protein [Okeania sp. SIO3I5]NEQ40192.1 PIN domain-containing protein [Okeania sp. SIO3I5]